MKKRLPTIIILTILLVGIGVLLYPTVSDWYNSNYATRVVEEYQQAVENLSSEEYDKLISDARAYNEKLACKLAPGFVLSDEETAEYESLLNIYGTMSYIEIPSVRIKLPIYHGISESALQEGVGHLPGSSLPVGGASTHCVLSGHRGLPSARLFTDIDQLVVGDVFMLHTLNETYTYEVDQILIVEPDDTSALGIEPGADLCTLVTCTPYGVNTQRLLVRGHRIANLTEDQISAAGADGVQIQPLMVAPFATIPILLIMLIVVFRTTRKTVDYAPAMFDAAEYYSHKKIGEGAGADGAAGVNDAQGDASGAASVRDGAADMQVGDMQVGAPDIKDKQD
jgi:sortase A